MRKYKIIVDSTSDFPIEWIKQLDVDIVPLYVIWPDGKNEPDSTQETKELFDFYKRLLQAKELPKTSQPSVEDFLKHYEKAEKEGYDGALVITITKELSGTFNSARLAAEQTKLPVRVVNSRLASAVIPALARYARELFDNGLELEEVAKAVEERRKKIGGFFFVSNFDYLVKGGRVSRLQWLLGSILRIKVGIYLDENGKMVPFTKARTTKEIVELLLKKSEEMGFKEGSEVGLMFINSGEEDLVKYFEDMVKSRFKIRYTYKSYTGKVITTHVGPGMAGFGFELFE